MNFPQHELHPEIVQQVLSREDWTINERSTALAILTFFGEGFDTAFLDCASDDAKAEILLRARIIEDTIMDKLARNALKEINGSLK